MYRRHALRWLAICVVASTGDVAADTLVFPHQAVQAVLKDPAGVRSPDERVLCSDDDGKPRATWPPGTSTAPRFKLDAHGRLHVANDIPAPTLGFDNDRAIGILEAQLPDQPPRVVFCGVIQKDLAYDLGKQASGTRLAVRVFASGPLAKSFKTYRNTKLGETQQRERDALHTEASLRDFVVVGTAAAVARNPATIDRAVTAADTARAKLQELKRDWHCNVNAAHGLMAPAVCDEATRIMVLVDAAEAGLQDLDLVDPRQVARVDVVQSLVALKVIDQMPIETPDTQCNALDRLRWLYAEDMFRLTSRANIPLAEHVIEAAYNAKHPPVSRIDTSQHYALLVSGVAIGDKTTFGMREGKQLTIEPGTLASTLITAGLHVLLPTFQRDHAGIAAKYEQLDKLNGTIARLTDQHELWDKLGPIADLIGNGTSKLRDDLRNATKTFEQMQHEVEGLDRPPLSIPSLICAQERRETAGAQIAVDEDAPPASGIDNLSFNIAPLSKDHELSVGLCLGDACALGDDDKTVKTRVSLTPMERGQWTLLAEIGAGVGLDTDKGLGSMGFRELSPPSFQPVFGSDGPDQVFELRQVSDSHNVISTALLVAYHLDDDWLAGLGPTLLIGSSGSLAAQWNLRLGRKLGSGIYFTFGPSVRAMQFPDDYEVGDRVSVPRAAMGTTPAPQVAMHYEPVFELQVGLGFDLAKLGSVTGDLYKALGGGK